MTFLSGIIFALLGRLWGYGDFRHEILGYNIKRPLVAILSAAVFLPAGPWIALAVLVLGTLGHALRDSIFELLVEWNTRSAVMMTIKALWFMPVMVTVYLLARGIVFDPAVFLCLSPLTRVPVQVACRFLPFPVSSDATLDSSWVVHFLLTKAASYETLFMVVIGLSLGHIAYGG